MSGCLRQIGCLVVLLALGVGAWLSRELWWERVTGKPLRTPVTWVPITPDEAPAARRRVEALQQREGEVFTSLTPGEVAALILGATGGRVPPGVQDVEASVVGDALGIRASLDLSSLRAVDGLGPLQALLTARQTVTITGRPRGVARGRGAFVVDAATVGGIEVPRPLLGALIAQLDRGSRDVPGDPTRTITFELPPYVGDIRVARGRVILYKSTP
ncbi:MAG: hypothetical protein IT361_13350 [Gemmatimonadaceae bacterium]|nr:hypothetical protein [Gemmatimonadaceae bacterium]